VLLKSRFANQATCNRTLRDAINLLFFVNPQQNSSVKLILSKQAGDFRVLRERLKCLRASIVLSWRNLPVFLVARPMM
jgi:hypothetical protein